MRVTLVDTDDLHPEVTVDSSRVADVLHDWRDGAPSDVHDVIDELQASLVTDTPCGRPGHASPIGLWRCAYVGVDISIG